MNEAKFIKKLFSENFNINLEVVNSKNFYQKLSWRYDPGEKEKLLENSLLMYLKNIQKETKNIKFLAQGTLYPDVIESSSNMGKKSVTIKSHHNVGGLPKFKI